MLANSGIQLLLYNGLMDYRERIVSDSSIRFGKSIVKGTRIAVSDVLEMLAAGDSNLDIVEEFPQLSLDDISACLAFAADRDRITRIA
jgi:uncharacterized protein (DUF433 family)